MPMLDKLLNIMAPHDCLVCGSEGKLLCNWCVLDALPSLPSRCYRCQRITTDFAVCDRCKKHTLLRHVWIRTAYDGTAKELLHQFKYGRAQAAADIIASSIDEILPYVLPGTLVVAVPTATSRVRERGYDQAALLGRAIAKKRELIWVRAVTRLSQSRQVGANRQQRLSQLRDAFLVAKPNLIKGADILLVDDVVTTGATLEAMTAVLKLAGAKSINAIAFAQKQ